MSLIGTIKSSKITSGNKIMYEYLWIIDYFDTKRFEDFICPEFETENNVKWKAIMTPIVTIDGIDYLTVKLYMETANRLTNFIAFNVSIKHTNDMYYEFGHVDNLLVDNCDNKITYRQYFINRREIFDKFLAVSRKFCVAFNIIEILGNYKFSGDNNANVDINNNPNNSLTTHCVFDVNGAEFLLHKKFFASRCPALANSLNIDQLDYVKIGDTTEQVFEAVINFLYYKKLPNLSTSNNAKSILAFADAYDIRELKLLCEKYLRDAELTNENVVVIESENEFVRQM